MTRTTMASYPSGHALAAATTAPGIVIALVPPGRARRRLLAVAVPLAGVTALSRTFLNAHWLSDVVGGFALGAGYALAVPGLVDLVWPSRLGTPRSGSERLCLGRRPALPMLLLLPGDRLAAARTTK
jgi:membrane-associated phospholipid phosphatase